MGKIRILHVIAGTDPKLGGVCQAMRTIIKGLSLLDVHNEVVSLDDPASGYLSLDPFKIYALGPGKGPWSYSSKLSPWLLSNLNNFDFVLIHGLWLYPSHSVIKAINAIRSSNTRDSVNKKIPKVFVMPHGMLDPYFQKASGRKIKAIRNWLFWKLIERKVINDADGVLFTCEEELIRAREPFKPYFPKRELIVGLGVETPPVFSEKMVQQFEKKCPSLRNKSFILFLSRIHEKKGVDLLVKAYEFHLKEHLKSISASDIVKNSFPKLVIAGPGLETIYGKKIRELVDQNESLRESVFFPGMLLGDEKWGAFYGCNAFILPSHQENFGIAVVEALACKKPVLISNQINIWREISNNGAGIVKDDTLAGTTELLKEWLTLSREDIKGMQYKALSAFENHFAVEPSVRKLLGEISK